MNDRKGKLDKPLFFLSFVVLAVISIPTIIFPDQAMNIVNTINTFICYNLGNYYVWFAFATVIFCLYICFSKYGKIKLGDPDTKPDFSLFSWGAMLFCGGIGGTVIYWGSIEWVYYFIDPPKYVEAGSYEAFEYAAALGPYHWGFITWTIYITCGVACAYLLYIRKSKVFRISEACRGALGDKVDGVLGKAIDIGFMFGLIGAAATAFGLQTPFIAALINRLTGIPDTTVLRLCVLLGVATIFGITSYLGVSKGMKRISDGNVALTICMLIFIAFAGNVVFTLNMATTSVGIIAENFISLSSWMDPFEVTDGFPAWWTVFYWAWAVMYAPFYGLFFAKISKGRTMGQMIAGTVCFGTLGCFTVFEVLGGYGMYQQFNGGVDVVTSLSENGAPNTIINILSTLPGGTVVLGIILVIIVLFSATTYDATSGVLAGVSQYELDENGESKPWLRLLWAFLLVVLPMGFIISGSPLKPLQTIVIIFALPLTFIMIITVVSFFKMVKKDVEEGKFQLPK